MADQISLEGKEYISSKRAAKESGYAQDYVGQLARGGQIDAQRVDGLWYVTMESLLAYKSKAEAYKPELPTKKPQPEAESLISFDGKDYISAARASEVTGYHQDYVGQLARSGTVLSRQVGSRWYVDRAHLLSHKAEKDSLLAAVQSQSVGIKREEPLKEDVEADETGPVLTYTSEQNDLLPLMAEHGSDQERSLPVPIRIARGERERSLPMIPTPKTQRNANAKPTFPLAIAAGGLLTIVIVLTFGFTTLKDKSMYAAVGSISRTGIGGAVVAVMTKAGDVLEKMIVPELIYQRKD